MSDREDFEEAASRLGYSLKMADTWSGEYMAVETDTAWHLWQEARAQSPAPDFANEEMLSEGVDSLKRGLEKFPENYTQIVNNIWEDMFNATGAKE